ncbi:unnamed protein product [Ixodes persulcatus]
MKFTFTEKVSIFYIFYMFVRRLLSISMALPTTTMGFNDLMIH